MTQHTQVYYDQLAKTPETPSNAPVAEVQDLMSNNHQTQLHEQARLLTIEFVADMTPAQIITAKQMAKAVLGRFTEEG